MGGEVRQRSASGFKAGLRADLQRTPKEAVFGLRWVLASCTALRVRGWASPVTSPPPTPLCAYVCTRCMRSPPGRCLQHHAPCHAHQCVQNRTLTPCDPVTLCASAGESERPSLRKHIPSNAAQTNAGAATVLPSRCCQQQADAGGSSSRGGSSAQVSARPGTLVGGLLCAVAPCHPPEHACPL